MKTFRYYVLLMAAICLTAFCSRFAMAQPPSEFALDANTVGLWHFNENSGTTAFDATSNHLDGTLQNGAGWSTGRWGSAVALDGVNDRIAVPDNSALDLTGALTVECWVYLLSTGHNMMLVCKDGDRTYTDWCYAIYMFHNNLDNFAFMIGDNGTGGGSHSHLVLWSTPMTPYLNRWTHVAGVFDGATGFLYVDGVLRAQQSFGALTVDVTANPLYMGSNWVNNGNNNLHGRIEEVRISNVARYVNDPGTPQLEVSMWLHRRTAHYSILQCGFSQGTYSSSNRGVRLFFGEHNLDHLDYMRFFDVNGNQLLNQRITYPADIWIKITLKRYEDRSWILTWDDGGPNQVSAQVTDGFAVFDNPHFWVQPVGYYSETGGFYLDDIQGRFTLNGEDYLLTESWDDGNWTSNPEWFEYDNQDSNFGINATRGHNAVPCLEGWSGNTGTGYTALYTPFIAQSSLSVVGPGFGDEWRVGQYGAGVEWSSENVSCCIKVDLYLNGNFVMNLAPCVPAEQETVSVNLPCDLAAGYGYQVYVEATCDPSVNDLGDPFLIRPCDYGFVPDANTAALYKFNECTGSVAHDASGNGYDLELVDGAGWWAYGQCGTAADLTDPDAKLNSAHIIGTGWNALTLEAWIKPTQIIAGTHHPIIVRYSYYTSDPAYIFELNGDGRLYGCVYNDAGQHSCVHSAPGVVAVGDSHLVALTWSAGRPSRIWVDGLLVASSDTAMSGVVRTSTDPLTVGWYHDTGYGDFYFQGYIDEVRISNIARNSPPVSLSVVGPGFGDEWRVGQYGASVEWDAVNVTGCIKVDLYRNNSFVMNIAACVPASQETLSWNVPCDVAQGHGYQIYVESNDDPGLNDPGNPFLIRENYPPESVDDLVIQPVGSDAHLHWSAVETDTLGNPLCPHVYLVFFEDDMGEDPDFLGWTADTTYVHAGVVRFSPQMFYDVEVFIGNVGLLAGATAELGERMKRSQLMSYLMRHW